MKNFENISPTPDSEAEDERSIFGEILDWMLAPLLFLWPIGIAATHYFVEDAISQHYDAALRERVVAMAQLIEAGGGPAAFGAPGVLAMPTSNGDSGAVYFQIVQGDGRKLAGGNELPAPPAALWQFDSGKKVSLRETTYRGVELQIASRLFANIGTSPQQWTLLEVGEPSEKRTQLANRIVAGVIMLQFILIPMAVALVWFGLRRGLRPLIRLQKTLSVRDPADLSPIAARRVPEELEPLLSAFNAMLKRMQRNVDAQQRFIADAAHQLRTPLAGMKMQAQLAARESDPQALRHALNQIASSVDRVARLASQLLTLARTESGEIGHSRYEVLDLDKLLRQCVEDWVPRALEKQIDLGYEPEAEAEVFGNDFLLRELVNNLIDNALRYTPADGCVTCRVRRNGEFLVLEVEDNGIGISLDEAELVFERFYRVNDANSEGSGLGLAIVREIASRHGAFAALRTNPKGHGAVARVVFPAYEETSSVLESPAVIERISSEPPLA